MDGKGKRCKLRFAAFFCRSVPDLKYLDVGIAFQWRMIYFRPDFPERKIY